jgi:hypothetical protein
MNIAIMFHEQNTCVSRIWKIPIIWKDTAANISLQADKQTLNITYYTMVNILNPLMSMSKKQVAASFALVLYSTHSIPDTWYTHNMLIHISVTSASYKICAFVHVHTRIFRKNVTNISICLLWTMSWLFKWEHRFVRIPSAAWIFWIVHIPIKNSCLFKPSRNNIYNIWNTINPRPLPNPNHRDKIIVHRSFRWAV